MSNSKTSRGQEASSSTPGTRDQGRASTPRRAEPPAGSRPRRGLPLPLSRLWHHRTRDTRCALPVAASNRDFLRKPVTGTRETETAITGERVHVARLQPYLDERPRSVVRAGAYELLDGQWRFEQDDEDRGL